MKELLLQYAQYNQWANKLIIDALLKLDEGAVDKDINSSFPSVRRTVMHTYGAESIWLQRLQLAEHPLWHGDDMAVMFEDACQNWQDCSGELLNFVGQQYDERGMQHVIHYYDMKGTSHKTPVFQVLQHVFNHSTYHRGQLVTMLRQLGVTDVPGTDFIGFARLKS